MNELRSIKALSKESLRGVEPSTPGKRLPKFEMVDPCQLYVEEAYQRDLSGNSTTLIRKIVGKFSWARFKPPICVRLPESGNVLVCIDGQHTAIAAASHPFIDKIPVMVVDAADVAARAAAFVGHNRDRIALTQMAIFHAELASGDPLAETIDRACRMAGAKILNKAVNLRNPTDPGHTIAVGTIRDIAKREGEKPLARYLGLLTKAGRGPIKADEIKGVQAILKTDPDLALDDLLQQVVSSKSAEQWAAIGAGIAAERGEHLFQGLTTAWCRSLDVRLNPAQIKSSAPKPIATRRLPSPVVKPTPEKTIPRQPEVPFRQPEEPFRQPLEPIRKPPAPPAPPAPVALDGKPAGERFVERNGIRFDLLTRAVQHRGREDVLDAEGLRMVAALARVMPAFLPVEILAKAAFGKAADADFKVKGTADRSNGKLSGLLLEIREIPKMGWMLADLGS